MKKTLLFGALGGVALYLFMRSKKKASTNAVVSDEGKSEEQKSNSLTDKIKGLPIINKVAKPVSKILIKKPKDEKPPKFGDPIGKPKEEKPPKVLKFGDPIGKPKEEKVNPPTFGSGIFGDIPRDPKTGRPKGMPLPPPPPAKVITPLSDGNAVKEISEPLTPPAPTVEPVLPSFVDQRKFYTPREPRKPKVIQFGDPRGRFSDREDFYGGSRPTDQKGRGISMPNPKKVATKPTSSIALERERLKLAELQKDVKPVVSKPLPISKPKPVIRPRPIISKPKPVIRPRPIISKPKPINVPVKPPKVPKFGDPRGRFDEREEPKTLLGGDTRTFTIPRINAKRPAVVKPVIKPPTRRTGKGSRGVFKPTTRRVGKGSRA